MNPDSSRSTDHRPVPIARVRSKSAGALRGVQDSTPPATASTVGGGTATGSAELHTESIHSSGDASTESKIVLSDQVLRHFWMEAVKTPVDFHRTHRDIADHSPSAAAHDTTLLARLAAYGACCIRLGDYAEGTRVLDLMLAHCQPLIRIVSLRTWIAAEQGDVDLVSRLHELFPDAVPSYPAALGLALIERPNPTAAFSYFAERTVRVGSERADYFLLEAEAYTAVGRIDEAQELLDRVPDDTCPERHCEIVSIVKDPDLPWEKKALLLRLRRKFEEQAPRALRALAAGIASSGEQLERVAEWGATLVEAAPVLDSSRLSEQLILGVLQQRPDLVQAALARVTDGKKFADSLARDLCGSRLEDWSIDGRPLRQKLTELVQLPLPPKPKKVSARTPRQKVATSGGNSAATQGDKRPPSASAEERMPVGNGYQLLFLPSKQRLRFESLDPKDLKTRVSADAAIVRPLLRLEGVSEEDLAAPSIQTFAPIGHALSDAHDNERFLHKLKGPLDTPFPRDKVRPALLPIDAESEGIVRALYSPQFQHLFFLAQENGFYALKQTANVHTGYPLEQYLREELSRAIERGVAAEKIAFARQDPLVALRRDEQTFFASVHALARFYERFPWNQTNPKTSLSIAELVDHAQSALQRAYTRHNSSRATDATRLYSVAGHAFVISDNSRILSFIPHRSA